MKSSKQIRILHFNDVYDIEEKQSSIKQTQASEKNFASSARFVTAMREHDCQDKQKTMVLFSGDMISPDKLSPITKGQHMVKVYNALNIEVSCLGNHELDFGIDGMLDVLKQCNSPWIISNLKMPGGDTIGGLNRIHIAEHQGVKIGIMGLCGQEWFDLLIMPVQKLGLVFEDFIQSAKTTSKELKDQGCEYIIAMTHLDFSNDRLLAEACQDDIDIILGGHDHISIQEEIGRITLIKSGTDFEEFSDLTIDIETNQVKREKVVISDKFAPDQDIESHSNFHQEDLNQKLSQEVGFLDVDLDARFDSIRTSETNCGNFYADLVLLSNFEKVDIVMMATGDMR